MFSNPKVENRQPSEREMKLVQICLTKYPEARHIKVTERFNNKV